MHIVLPSLFASVCVSDIWVVHTFRSFMDKLVKTCIWNWYLRCRKFFFQLWRLEKWSFPLPNNIWKICWTRLYYLCIMYSELRTKLCFILSLFCFFQEEENGLEMCCKTSLFASVNNTLTAPSCVLILFPSEQWSWGSDSSLDARQWSTRSWIMAA